MWPTLTTSFFSVFLKHEIFPHSPIQFKIANAVVLFEAKIMENDQITCNTRVFSAILTPLTLSGVTG